MNGETGRYTSYTCRISGVQAKATRHAHTVAQVPIRSKKKSFMRSIYHVSRDSMLCVCVTLQVDGILMTGTRLMVGARAPLPLTAWDATNVSESGSSQLQANTITISNSTEYGVLLLVLFYRHAASLLVRLFLALAASIPMTGGHDENHAMANWSAGLLARKGEKGRRGSRWVISGAPL